MTTPEGKIKQKLDTMLKLKKSRGVWYFSPQAGPFGRSGVPDRIVCACGVFIGIEVKANNKRPMTALQQQCSEKIEKAGGKFFLVHDVESIAEIEKFINKAIEGRLHASA